jgi:hypothetical protein
MDISDLGLRIVPIETVVPHELYDPLRVERLSIQLRKEGWLKNPPLVAERDGTHVVMDGATRTQALRSMGFQHILVQIVDPAKVRVETWDHLVIGRDADSFYEAIQRLPQLSFQRLSGTPIDNRNHRWAGGLYFADGRAFSMELPPDCTPANEVEILNELVEVYTGEREIRRSMKQGLDTLRETYPDITAMVSFPRYTAHDILEFGMQCLCVPPGITRCIIPGRILRANVDLTLLSSTVLTLEQKNMRLTEYLQARLTRQPLRYYEEPIYILED